MRLSATGNHKNIAKALGYNIKEYRYWDAAARKFDVDGMIEDLRVGFVSELTAKKYSELLLTSNDIFLDGTVIFKMIL